MQVTHALNYRKIIEIAELSKATSVSFQHHVFVNFLTERDAQEFKRSIANLTDMETWDINTDRPGVPYEVIVQRWK